MLFTSEQPKKNKIIATGVISIDRPTDQPTDRPKSGLTDLLTEWWLNSHTLTSAYLPGPKPLTGHESQQALLRVGPGNQVHQLEFGEWLLGNQA